MLDADGLNLCRFYVTLPGPQPQRRIAHCKQLRGWQPKDLQRMNLPESVHPLSPLSLVSRCTGAARCRSLWQQLSSTTTNQIIRQGAAHHTPQGPQLGSDLRPHGHEPPPTPHRPTGTVYGSSHLRVSPVRARLGQCPALQRRGVLS